MDIIVSQISLESFLQQDEKILIGLSGGPDSSFLFHLVLKFYRMRGRDLSNILVCSLDHQMRLESKSEVSFLSQKCVELGISFVTAEYDQSTHDESSMRKRRHGKFVEFCHSFGVTKILLGHNLTDRFETMILNMCRGAGLTGMSNMSKLESHRMDPNIVVARPLLDLSKNQILKFCDELDIPYFVDPSNDDSLVSQRNFVRNEIIPKIDSISHVSKDGTLKFRNSFVELFDQMENINSLAIESFDLQKINLYPSRNAKFGYSIHSKYLINTTKLVQILKDLNLYNNVSKSRLNDLFVFLTTKSSGYKYINSTYFMLCHSYIYIIQAPKDFWKLNSQIVEKDFVSLDHNYQKIFSDDSQGIDIWLRNLYKLPDTETNILQKKLKYGFFDIHPSIDLKIHNKTLNEWSSNRKIPFFIRDLIIVLDQNK